MERWGYYWAFTSLSAQRLFQETFPASCIQIKTYGNVLTATAFLYGMAVEELKQEEMDFLDEDYQVIIAVMARKPGIIEFPNAAFFPLPLSQFRSTNRIKE
jgi:hypothetical protein